MSSKPENTNYFREIIRRDILSEVSKYMLENPETESIHVNYDNGLVVSG